MIRITIEGGEQDRSIDCGSYILIFADDEYVKSLADVHCDRETALEIGAITIKQAAIVFDKLGLVVDE